MICSRAEILVYLRLAHKNISSADDALLDLVHPLAESAVKRWLEQACEIKLITELLPSRERLIYDRNLVDADIDVVNDRVQFSWGGYQALQLQNTPVSVVGLTVSVDSSAKAGQASTAFDTTLTLGTNYWLDCDESGLSHTGIIYRTTAWPDVPRSVRVQYYGGMSAEQLVGDEGGALTLATLITIKKAFESAKISGAPKLSERLGKYQYTTGEKQLDAYLGGGALPAEAMQLLQSYRNYSLL
jgi:hypothetical protein